MRRMVEVVMSLVLVVYVLLSSGPVSAQAPVIQQAVIALFDQSDSMSWLYLNSLNNRPIAEAAVEALRRQLQPGSSLKVASFGDFFLVSRELAQTRDMSAELAVVLGRHGGPSPIWDAVVSSTGLLRSSQGGKVILLVTDGRSSANEHSHREALDDARLAGVRIFVAAIKGSGPLPAAAAERLRSLAGDTGGSYREILPRDLPSFFRSAVSTPSR